LKVVTFTPAPGQAIPSELMVASPFEFSVTQHAGYACVVSDRMPVDWPIGYSALIVRNGRAVVHNASGSVVVRYGATYQFGVLNFQSPGDACSSKGQNVQAILDVRALHANK